MTEDEYENTQRIVTVKTLLKGIDKIKDNMEIMGRRSTPRYGIDKHGETLKQTSLTGDIYLITDGETNCGRKITKQNNEQQKKQTKQDKENEKREADESEGKIIVLQNFYVANPSSDKAGKGKSFKFDNRMAEGRHQNRCMDFVFE